jgi:hypothetical protein
MISFKKYHVYIYFSTPHSWSSCGDVYAKPCSCHTNTKFDVLNISQHTREVFSYGNAKKNKAKLKAYVVVLGALFQCAESAGGAPGI